MYTYILTCICRFIFAYLCLYIHITKCCFTRDPSFQHRLNELQLQSHSEMQALRSEVQSVTLRCEELSTGIHHPHPRLSSPHLFSIYMRERETERKRKNIYPLVLTLSLFLSVSLSLCLSRSLARSFPPFCLSVPVSVFHSAPRTCMYALTRVLSLSILRSIITRMSESFHSCNKRRSHGISPFHMIACGS